MNTVTTRWDSEIDRLEKKQTSTGGYVEGLNLKELRILGRIKEQRQAYLLGYRDGLKAKAEGVHS